MTETPNAPAGGFSYARTLVVTAPDGLRPYLILVRDGWPSVVRLEPVPRGERSRLETWSAAAELARVFYQDVLRQLPEELQARFHQQIGETDDPYELIDRIRHTRRLPRLVGIDWTRYGRSEQVRVSRDLNTGEYRHGDAVLLAGEGFWDTYAVIEAVDEEQLTCRIENDPGPTADSGLPRLRVDWDLYRQADQATIGLAPQLHSTLQEGDHVWLTSTGVPDRLAVVTWVERRGRWVVVETHMPPVQRDDPTQG